MKMSIFTIYDSKAMAYLQPFFMRSSGEAIRALKETLKDPEHNFCKYPEDYVLFELGTFCQETAELSFDKLQSLGCLINFLVPEKKVPHVVEDEMVGVSIG